MNNNKEIFEYIIVDKNDSKIKDSDLNESINNASKKIYEQLGIESDIMTLRNALRKAEMYDSLLFIFKCPFEIVLEAFKNGIIDKKGNHRDVSLHYGKVRSSMKEYYFDAYDHDGAIILPLRDYLYTWWLPSDKRK